MASGSRDYPRRLPRDTTRGLREVSFERAMRHEPTPQFPGVDMDAIYPKPELSFKEFMKRPFGEKNG